jgi:hypothetical protein
MDFEKLLARREANQAAVELPAPAEAPARRARQQVEGSKHAAV